ncbi:hypothetical protein BLNAU_8724 [Blattamonas nauphoetae]|uniref:Protein kinase domain-containing protein n=1 Tax=Blattamonas nauphoetae TaxID=2049346 RepID=A0ABQ9XXZ0_9EUKA|nr:hypothetical protein BLNAU_8724 [Blattamonas nauphoetae]
MPPNRTSVGDSQDSLNFEDEDGDSGVSATIINTYAIIAIVCVHLVAAGTMRPDQDKIVKTEETGLKALAPSIDMLEVIPRGIEREAVKCEEPFETVAVNGMDTLFNRLHKSESRGWERLQWKMTAHSLTKGLAHLWKRNAHCDVLCHLNPHNVVLDVDNTPCLLLTAQPNTQPAEQCQMNQEEEETQKDTEMKQSLGERLLNEKKNEDGQRWEAPEVTRTIESQSKNEIDQAKACVFSLGLVMWEMATQLVPFGEIDGVNAHRQIGSGVTPRMDKLAGSAGGELIKRCLALNPNIHSSLFHDSMKL